MTGAELVGLMPTGVVAVPPPPPPQAARDRAKQPISINLKANSHPALVLAQVLATDAVAEKYRLDMRRLSCGKPRNQRWFSLNFQMVFTL